MIMFKLVDTLSGTDQTLAPQFFIQLLNKNFMRNPLVGCYTVDKLKRFLLEYARVHSCVHICT